MLANVIGKLPATLIPIISEALPSLLGQIVPLLMDLMTSLPSILLGAVEQMLPALLQVGERLLNGGIIEGIIATLPSLMEQGLNIILTLGTAIIEHLPEIITRGIEIITTLTTTIIGEFPNMLSNILDAVKKINWWEIGKAIIDGIITGVKNMISSLIDTVVSAAEQAWDAVKDFLGIASPSKKFKYIGLNMALGLSEGYENAMPNVLKDISKATSSITDNIVGDVNATIKPNQSKRINNLEINFAIDNSGKDITDENIEQWSNILVNSINEKLGMAV